VKPDLGPGFAAEATLRSTTVLIQAKQRRNSFDEITDMELMFIFSDVMKP
jgi:hypothetical protein